jgi:hypothetical protein
MTGHVQYHEAHKGRSLVKTRSQEQTRCIRNLQSPKLEQEMKQSSIARLLRHSYTTSHESSNFSWETELHARMKLRTFTDLKRFVS